MLHVLSRVVQQVLSQQTALKGTHSIANNTPATTAECCNWMNRWPIMGGRGGGVLCQAWRGSWRDCQHETLSLCMGTVQLTPCPSWSKVSRKLSTKTSAVWWMFAVSNSQPCRHMDVPSLPHSCNWRKTKWGPRGVWLMSPMQHQGSI